MARSLFDSVLSTTFGAVTQLVPWHKLPAYVAVANLLAFRHTLREKNLHDTERFRRGKASSDRQRRRACHRAICSTAA